MTITVDEALQAAREHGGCDTDCVTPELAAEVESLRKENNALRATQVGPYQLRCQEAEREVERLRTESARLLNSNAILEREAQAARLALDVAMRALKCHQDRKPLADAAIAALIEAVPRERLVPREVADLRAWERNHPIPGDEPLSIGPKPGAAT